LNATNDSTDLVSFQLIAEKAAAQVANGHSKSAPSKEQQEKPKAKEPSKESSSSVGFSVDWKKMQLPCMLPAVTDDTSSDDDKSSKQAYPKPAGSTPKSSYTSDESSLRNRAFVANKQ